MTQSIEVLSKQLTRDLKVLVKYDDQPSHPRREDDNLFTIAAWHPRHALSDVPEFKTPTGFLRSLGIIGSKDTVEAVRECRLERSKLDPPGMLRKIYMYEHGEIALSTAPFRDPWDSGLLGWAYASEAKLKGECFDEPTAEKILESELLMLQAWANGHVYWLSLVRNGTVEAGIRDIYPDERWGSLSDELLEQRLEDLIADAGLSVAEMALIHAKPSVDSGEQGWIEL